MAIIPNGEKVLMTSADVNTTYGGSAALKEMNKWYTIQDFKDTVGGGGGGLGTFNITSNGSIGPNATINYSITASVIGTNQGVQEYPVLAVPNINLQYDAYSGLSFTATEISYPGLTGVSGFYISNTPLVKVSVPDLAAGYGGMDYAQLQNNQFLQELRMPALTKIQGLSVNNSPALTTFDFSSLTELGYGGLSLVNVGITAIAPTTFPVLSKINGGLQISGITSVNMPSVQTIGGISENNYTIQTINLPNVSWLNTSGINFSSKSSLTSINLGFSESAGQRALKRIGTSSSATVVYGFLIDLSNCALDTASVDNVILSMIALDGTNGTVSALNGALYLNGGTNSAPGPAGMSQLTTLIARGWYVQTN